MMAGEAKDGNDDVDEIGTEPNLDFFFDNNPRHFTEEQIRELIIKERDRRALFIEKRSK